jgi:epoxyqueuosine reductase
LQDALAKVASGFLVRVTFLSRLSHVRESMVSGSAIWRDGRAGFARNVCVGLGNWGSEAAVPLLRSALADPDPLVRGHAAWALGAIPSSVARVALEEAASTEEDPFVREEVDEALDRAFTTK